MVAFAIYHANTSMADKLEQARKYVAGVHARGFRYRSEPVVLTEWRRDQQAVRALSIIRRLG